MIAPKWKLIAGNVYQLSAVFDNDQDAIIHARNLRENRKIMISKTPRGTWAVYWRPKPEDELNLATHCGLNL
ncbi:hypothetical protein EU538_10205 [Candidatus Thorarchaeota archaeon]|nr:MAG: hypothetical protein EU538_10205 [Candidatus Thorarchaeota archaeon]